jgi:Cu/Ag efflux protein CusF
MSLAASRNARAPKVQRGNILRNDCAFSINSKLKLIIITFIICAAACNQKPSAADDQLTANVYHGTGVIEALDRDKAKIKIKHEAIENYMDAMTMTFKAQDARLLENLQVGDKIDFTLEERAGIVTIIAIKKRA